MSKSSKFIVLIYIFLLSILFIYIAPGAIGKLELRKLFELAQADTSDEVEMGDTIATPKYHIYSIEDRSLKRVYPWLIYFPESLLKALLAFVMGGFGGNLQCIRQILKPEKEKENITWYLFRPIYGVLMSIVVLVVSYAIPYLLQAGNVYPELNIYVLSTLCLFAGIFSEDVFKWINAISKNIFDSIKND